MNLGTEGALAYNKRERPPPVQRVLETSCGMSFCGTAPKGEQQARRMSQSEHLSLFTELRRAASSALSSAAREKNSLNSPSAEHSLIFDRWPSGEDTVWKRVHFSRRVPPLATDPHSAIYYSAVFFAWSETWREGGGPPCRVTATRAELVAQISSPKVETLAVVESLGGRLLFTSAPVRHLLSDLFTLRGCCNLNMRLLQVVIAFTFCQGETRYRRVKRKRLSS